MSGLPPNDDLQQQQARMLHALSQSDQATMEGFMSGAFNSFAQPLNLAGMMQGIQAVRSGNGNTNIRSAPGGNGRSIALPAMGLAPFNAASFGGSTNPNTNFLAFISPSTGQTRPNITPAGGRGVGARVGSGGPSTNVIPPTAPSNPRDEKQINPAKRRKPTVSADGGMLLLPRTSNDVATPSNPTASKGNSMSRDLGYIGANSGSSLGVLSSMSNNGMSQSQRRKHRVKGGSAVDIALSNKAQELSDFFKEALPSRQSPPSAKTVANWLQSHRHSQNLQDQEKAAEMTAGHAFDKHSSQAELLVRASTHDANTQEEANQVSSPGAVFSQSYDEGVSLFNQVETEALVVPEEPATTSTNSEGSVSTSSSSSIHNNWLPDLLLLISQTGHEKCFRELVQCNSLLLNDLNAKAPVQPKEKPDKTTDKDSSGLSTPSSVPVAVSSLHPEIAEFLSQPITLVKREVLHALISANGFKPSSGLVTLDVLRGDDSLVHNAWVTASIRHDFKQVMTRARMFGLGSDNLALANPFGAHGFDAETCDRWTFPNPTARTLQEKPVANQSRGRFDVSELPLKEPTTQAIPDQSVVGSSAYVKLCDNYDACQSSLLLSFPSASFSPSNNNNTLSVGGGNLKSDLLNNDNQDPMIMIALLLGHHAANKLGEFGPSLIATTYNKLSTWQRVLAKHAPHLNVLPYWGCTRDRASMHGFLDLNETGGSSSSWHVLLAPVDAVLAEVIPLARLPAWQLMVLDELQPILMNSNLTSQRAALLRVRTCHGRVILQQGLAPRQGNEYDLAAAVSSWSLDTLSGLACSLNPEYHAVLRRVVGKIISFKPNCHHLLEEKIIPLLLCLIEPSVVSIVSDDRNLSVELENNKVTEWREIAMNAVMKQMEMNLSVAMSKNKEASKLLAMTKESIAALCLSFEEYNISRDDGIDSLSSNNSSLTRSVWFDALSKISPQGNRLISALKPWTCSSAPSSSFPHHALSGYDDDFTTLLMSPSNHMMMANHSVIGGSFSMAPAAALVLPKPQNNTTSTTTSSTALSDHLFAGGDSLLRNFQNGGSSLPPACATEFMSPWQAPEEMEEDAEDELAGDVYPYGDYLYGTAESSARGIGVGGAGGVVLDLSGVPELIPPMPRQRTSGPATSSRFRGVCRSKRTATDKWQAQISYGGTNYYLGLFDSESEAGVAYARAHYKFYGAGSVGLSSYAAAAAAAKDAAPTSSSNGTADGNRSSKEEDSLGTNSITSGSSESDTLNDVGENTNDANSMENDTSFHLSCSSKVASLIKPAKQSSNSSAPVATITTMTVSNSTAAASLDGLSSLPWNDELERKYWILSEEIESGYLKSTSSNRPGTPTKGLGEKEKKRKGTKINLEDNASEAGLQAMVFVPADGVEWPFGGILTPTTGAASSSSFMMRNRTFDMSSTSLTSTQPASVAENSGESDGMLSLEFSGAWPGLSGSTGPAAVTPEDTSSSPMAAAMTLLRPLIELKKKEEKLHHFDFTVAIESGVENNEQEEGGQDVVGTTERSIESLHTGFAQLVGFVADKHNVSNSKSFKCTMMKPSITLGNAAHESPLQGRASLSSWHKALSSVCGAALNTTSLFTSGSTVGDMDVHLGESIEPGVNACVFWVGENMTDGDGKGRFYLQALCQGVAVEGKVVPVGNRVALSSGSVLSFGSTLMDKSHQPKVIAQFLLPETSSVVADTTMVKPVRASEHLLMGALRIASLDADLRKYLPNLMIPTEPAAPSAPPPSAPLVPAPVAPAPVLAPVLPVRANNIQSV